MKAAALENIKIIMYFSPSSQSSHAKLVISFLGWKILSVHMNLYVIIIITLKLLKKARGYIKPARDCAAGNTKAKIDSRL